MKVRLFAGLTLAILILAAVHVFVSLNLSGSSYKILHKKISYVWLASLFICIAVLILSILALGHTEEAYGSDDDNESVPTPLHYTDTESCMEKCMADSSASDGHRAMQICVGMCAGV